MNIQTEQLIRIATLLDLIPVRSGIPCSEYIRVSQEKGKIIWNLASDLAGRFELETTEKWPAANPYFLDRSLFMPFVMAAKTMRSKSNFEILTDKDALVMKHGRRRVLFTKVSEVTGYGKVETDGASVEIKLSSKQKELILCAESCAGTDAAKPHLNCVFITESGFVMASNQVTIFSAWTDKFNQSLPMPLHLLKMLDVPGINKMLLAPKYVMLKMDCGDIVQSLPQKAIKEFPVTGIGVRMSEASAYKKRFTASARRIYKVLERFTQYMAPVKRQEKVVIISMAAGDPNVKISAVVGQAHLSEVVRANAALDKPFKMEWSLEMIMPVFKYLSEKDVEITVAADPKSPCLITGPSLQMLLARKIS